MENRLISSDFLKRLERLSLNIEKLMNAGSGGARKSRAKGSSVEFSDFREYSSGDDIKRIDWNAYGRLNRLFIKLFMEEREAFINIFLDCSKSMEFDNKANLSMELTAALSYLSLINMDRLCLNLMEGKNLRVSEVYGGRGQFNRSASFINKVEFVYETDLITAIKNKRFPGRGLAIIISDFFTDGDLEEILKFLTYNKQEIVLLHILSFYERQPDFGGSIRLKDSETGEEINVELSTSILDRYEKALNSFITDINEKCKKYGGLYANVTSNEKMEKVLFEDLIKSRIIK